MSAAAFTLYGMTGSGNCEKVRLVADHLGVAYDWVEVAMGGAREPAFKRDVNPAGQVPAIVYPDGRRLAQSNAIIFRLAEGSDLVPADADARADMLAWMFWEQYSHEPYVAVRLALLKYRKRAEADLDPELLVRGTAALKRLDDALSDQPWLVGAAPSLADIALYPYSRDAPEGGFDLAPFPALRDWIARMGERFAPRA